MGTIVSLGSSGPREGGGVGDGGRVLSRVVATATGTSGSGPRGKVLNDCFKS